LTRPASLALALALLGTGACATLPRRPPPGVAAAARQTRSYSALLKVRVKTRDLRGRSRVLLAFQRPDRLRVEIPGPGGLRLLAVTRDGALTVLFPAERRVFKGEADRRSMDALLGIALEPDEIMDALLGVAPSGLRAYRAGWGPRLPRRIQAEFVVGGRLDVGVEEPETGVELPARAFDEPAHRDYVELSLDEARGLWGRR